MFSLAILASEIGICCMKFDYRQCPLDRVSEQGISTA
jgi:hypothetical protein